MPDLQQNPDGSWSEAEPLGFVPGTDWEVYSQTAERGRYWRAEAFDGARKVASVEAKTRLGLRGRMILATWWRTGSPAHRILW